MSRSLSCAEGGRHVLAEPEKPLSWTGFEVKVRNTSLSSSQPAVLPIDAAFLSMGYVGDGQADGPYPGMYEHWPSRHLYKPSGVSGQFEQGAFVEENAP